MKTQRVESYSIIAVDKFIQATRDSGYKGTASAISELVDNSIQAGAREINITLVMKSDETGIEVAVLDDGCGMDAGTLRQALRFGGSTRFGDRRGLGRYGMGLPNASLSQARRLNVYTWQKASAKARHVSYSYLDVDEIMRGNVLDVPKPVSLRSPPFERRTPSGTLVSWVKCDRLDNRRISTIVQKLEDELGRRFRHFIWKGLRIRINGDSVQAIDPLFLQAKGLYSGGLLFGEEMRYEVPADSARPGVTGLVRVRFSELPVQRWHKLSNEEKRRMGISKGAGVSLVRGGREVDYGWFFMGTKHRENYDDWWRCEIQFDPLLDEAFGITHTKQQVRPHAHLIEALTPEIEATARALNARARKAHLAAKAGERFSEAERVASERERLLPPLPSRANRRPRSLMRELERRFPNLRGITDEGGATSYKILEGAVKETSFFNFAFDGKKLVLLVNPEHPFYREIYRPLSESESPVDQQLRSKLELMLLAAARSEAMSKDDLLLTKHRKDWSNTLATFLND